MGTRGFVGFVADDTEKIAYNHFDSYPSGLGVDVLEWLRFAATDVASLREQVKALRVVESDSAPTTEDVERLADFADLNVSSKDVREWYVLLRETQGNPGAMLQAGVILNAASFPLDSLFAEWGYVVDLDAETFEVYRGFQQSPHNKGRFARRGREKYGDLGLMGGGYYPVALVKSWPLSDLPSDAEFVAAFKEGE